jgi:ABC-type polar amino acid transport system ATPase subunit
VPQIQGEEALGPPLGPPSPSSACPSRLGKWGVVIHAELGLGVPRAVPGVLCSVVSLQMTMVKATPPLIAVDNLQKGYGGVSALSDITFRINASELTAIIGPSGCGKSTLLRCLNGLELHDSGTVRIDQISLERDGRPPASDLNSKLRLLREEVGMVFQSFNLFPHLTVLENAVLAQTVVKRVERRKAEQEARELLAKVGLSERSDYYPAQLSGGQQQRAAIARALAMKPKVMLYDEPTSALDPGLVGEVLNIMRQLDDEGMTQIVVTHEMRFAREAANRVIVLESGRIIEEGSADIIFSAPRDPRTREFLRSVL